jgi:hypothetical protein
MKFVGIKADSHQGGDLTYRRSIPPGHRLHQQGERIFQPDHTGVIASEVPEAHHDEVVRRDDDRAPAPFMR